MSLYGQHLLSVKSVSPEDRETIFDIARRLRPIAKGEMCTKILDGAVLGSFFFEPSTRTRLSFDAAFMRLGGRVSSTIGTEVSSLSKGESYADTARTTAGYFDAFVMRHSNADAMDEFCAATNIPLINAGSGPKEHPTQALLDTFTIVEECARLGKSLDGLTLALVGDLKYGRTIHSLIYLMSLYHNITFVTLNPPPLALPEDVASFALSHGHKIVAAKTLQEALAHADVVYATRLQKERLSPADQVANLGADFQITKTAIDAYAAKPDIFIMHPLPRDSRDGAFDLSTSLDGDPRLAIFRQTDNGLLIRMALFLTILGMEKDIESSFRPVPWFRPKQTGINDSRN